MKRLYSIFIVALLTLCSLPITAKDNKPQDICEKILYFNGNVVKDKATKQKVPTGIGKLFIQKDIVSNYVSIEGDFNGNTVDNATFIVGEDGHGNCFWNGIKYSDLPRSYWTNSDEEKIFQGTVSYSYSYNKNTKDLLLTVNLQKGDLLCHSLQSSKTWITPEDKISYTISFAKNGLNFFKIMVYKERRYNVSPNSIKFNTQEVPKDVDNTAPLIPLITESEWEAKENGGHWEINWIKSTLKNGAEIQPVYKLGGVTRFTLSGNNGVHFNDEDVFANLKLPLSDRGYFEWEGESKRMRLYYPTGEIYEGTFNKLPFNKDKRPYDISAIMRSTVADFGMGEGTYTNASGKAERVKNGEFIDRIAETIQAAQEQPKSPEKPDFFSLTASAIPLKNNHAKFTSLCHRDFWTYIGKKGASERQRNL